MDLSIVRPLAFAPPTKKPRPYQGRACARVFALFRGGLRTVMLVAPTGSGKGPMVGWVTRWALEQGWSVLVLQNREEIVDQNVKHVADAGVPLTAIGVIRADDPRRNPMARVQVASCQTLGGWVGRKGVPHAELVIVDEAHGVANPTHQKILGAYPDAKVLGLTATPWRLDKKGLAEHFMDSVVAATVPELVADGWLVPSFCYTHPQGPNLDDVHVQHGDFVQDELSRVMSTPLLLGNALEHYQRHAQGRSTFGFAVDIDHADKLAETFNAAGIRAIVIHGGTPRPERKKGLDDLRTGRVRVVFNCQVFTQGVDVPEVKCIGLYRPTLSKALAWQMLGRGMRPAPHTGYADLIVLDHAGILPLHGHPLEPQDYSLNWTPLKRRGEPPVKNCPRCHLTVALGTMRCPGFVPNTNPPEPCGYEWPAKPTAELPGDLQEYGPRPPVVLPPDVERRVIADAIRAAQKADARNLLAYAGAILEKKLRRAPNPELLGAVAAELLAAPPRPAPEPMPAWLKANGRPIAPQPIPVGKPYEHPPEPPVPAGERVRVEW